MGNSEEAKSCKIEKSSSNAQDKGNLHLYPDWAAMQAYYGPRVAVPPFFNSAVPSGHSPHPYMWGPQPMMPSYGAPYAAMYAHGGVYPHPGVPIGSHLPSHGMTPSHAVSQAMNATSMSMDASAKSSVNTDRGMMAKLKEFDRLAMSVGNSSAENGEGETDNGHSQSEETEGSSDASYTRTARVGEKNKKRSRETTPNNSDDGKSRIRSCPSSGEVDGDSEKGITVAVSHCRVAEKMTETKLSPRTTTLELRDPAGAHVKASPANVLQIGPALPNEPFLQNNRELKREKRKQSNRESARRSRLRKQAEAGELGTRVQSLIAENSTLRAEMNKLKEKSEKLRLENASLMGTLKMDELGQIKKVSLGKIDGDKRLQPIGTANLLARVNNSGEVYENNSSGAKLHQLLDASPRTDPVAAR